MIDVETARWGMAGAVVATRLFAWALGGWLRACGFRPFRDAARLVPHGSVFGQGSDGVTGLMNVGRNGMMTVSPHSN